MDSLFISSTQDTPSIVFNKERNTFMICERSYPEDAFDFYKPILRWVDDYIKKPNENTVFEFKLEYFNTTSGKQLFKIMLMLEELSKTKTVVIHWHYKKGDKEMFVHGEIFSKIITVSFKFIEY